jgi:hypothetical protein
MPLIAYVGVNSFLVDYKGYSMMLEGNGTIELNYVVYSNNFPAIRCTYILEMSHELNKTQFYGKD